VSAVETIDVSSWLKSVVEDFFPAAEDRGQWITANVAPHVQLSGDRGSC